MRPSIMMFILLTRRQPVMKLLMSVGSASCFETRDLLGPVFPANNRAKNRGRPENRARSTASDTGFLFLRLCLQGPHQQIPHEHRRPIARPARPAGGISGFALLKRHGLISLSDLARKYTGRGRARVAQNKAPRGLPPGHPA